MNYFFGTRIIFGRLLGILTKTHVVLPINKSLMSLLYADVILKLNSGIIIGKIEYELVEFISLACFIFVKVLEFAVIVNRRLLHTNCQSLFLED